MTKINKMVMHGFKSFAKHTELMFGGDFNCVLGPNGSGKSNILDALCFVLGRLSSKSLRAEKSANLIYNGGKTKKPAKQGEVSIYFDNSSMIFPTDDKEVKITRIVRQNGQSIYKINDKARTRQQIVDLLNIAKIDPDGYNIILQGDITRFVGMPSIERRMLIEEISGISVYEEKKHKAMLELEKVGSKLNEAEIILTERKTYLKELKSDRDQALKFKEMSDRVNESKASLLKMQIDRKEKEKSELQEKIKSSREELEKVNGKTAELKKENENKRQAIEGITKEIEEKGEKEQIELNREIESIKIELTKNNSRIETSRGEISKIKKRKEDLRNALKETDEKINALKANKERMEKEAETKSKEISSINKKIEEFREKNKLNIAGDLDKQISNIDEELEKEQKDINLLREEQHKLLREKDSLEHQINTIDEKIKKVLQIEKEHKEQIELLRKNREDFKSSTLELNQRLSEDNQTAGQLANARKKLASSNEELEKLKARSISIQEVVYSDIAAKNIMGQKDKRKGIYGTVAELGDVNAKYSLALEVAAGPRLKSIVVEDDKTAAELIKYLKDSKLGTATFLPLNKIKAKAISSEMAELANAKGSHGLAIELISFDEKFKKVFSYVFSDTIVVDNIDVARRLGIGNAKMVTLDGDMAEISGAMHGGYRVKRQGYGFREKEITKDIKEYEEVALSLKTTVEKLEKKKIENENRINELRNKKAGLEGEIIKAEKSMHLEPGDVELSKKETLEEEAKNAELKLKGIAEKITDATKKLTDNKIKKQELRSQITQVRDPSLLAELTTFEQKRKELEEAIIHLNSETKGINTQVGGIFTAEREKTREILKQLDKEEEEFNKEIIELANKINERNKTLKEEEKKATQFRARYKSLFESRGRISEEIQKNEAVIEKKQEQSREVEIGLNTLSLKNAEAVASLAALEQEFEQYRGARIIANRNEEELKREISRFEKLKEEIGSVNMRALDIYEDAEKEFNNLMEKKDKLLEEKEDVVNMMNEIESKKKELFMKTFDAVNENFKAIFNSLSTKGEASLVLENSENPFEAGLDILVRIAGTKFLDIKSLSGGEQTLTALAFIFSVQEHEPASFYVLDEVDAALDKHNSEKFSKLIRKYAENAQYLIVSHNDHVISEADTLYGVSSNEDGTSNVVSLKI